eukprot:CAMPEP_0117496944 /NCGR_PEP_ID=MMETSP0784-20121206/20922_1 /TAXON_ID=39447 /ORGANISM="" /LENGTH=197 /DNA_ID=CAMNT_0005291939 /DNA_START=52 /DNA_END=645 /DNA_ORIENTATION=-
MWKAGSNSCGRKAGFMNASFAVFVLCLMAAGFFRPLSFVVVSAGEQQLSISPSLRGPGGMRLPQAYGSSAEATNASSGVPLVLGSVAALTLGLVAGQRLRYRRGGTPCNVGKKLITYEGGQARFVVEKSKDAGEIKNQVGGAAAQQNINRELRNLLLGIGEKIRKTKVEEFGLGGVNHEMDVARVTTTDEAGRFRFK